MALTNMGVRTGLEGIKRMASVLVQTMKYGTPLSDALRVLSAEMRQEMLIRYETRAARLPVLLTIPMILFILPCIFLIVGGPAAIQVDEVLSSLTVTIRTGSADTCDTSRRFLLLLLASCAERLPTGSNSIAAAGADPGDLEAKRASGRHAAVERRPRGGAADQR